MFTDAGASGSGVLGTAGEACTAVDSLAGAAWPLAGASSGARTRAATRLARPAAMRCLHQPDGALGKSLHSRKVSLALAAISATAARNAWRAGVSPWWWVQVSLSKS